jgi:hypothetical protein
MTEDLYVLILVILMIASGISMINYVQDIKKERAWFYNPLDIIEYVQITKKKSGKIGYWFWVFILSVSLLILR